MRGLFSGVPPATGKKNPLTGMWCHWCDFLLSSGLLFFHSSFALRVLPDFCGGGGGGDWKATRILVEYHPHKAISKNTLSRYFPCSKFFLCVYVFS